MQNLFLKVKLYMKEENTSSKDPTAKNDDTLLINLAVVL